MQLSRATDYALRVLIYLATCKDDEVVPTSAIAAVFSLSEQHLRKVTGELVAHGWLEGRRGAGGGVRLVVAPAEITVGEVVRTLERLDLLDCLDPERDTLEFCRISPGCRLKAALSDALEAFLAVLDDTTVADLTKNRRLRKLLHVVD